MRHVANPKAKTAKEKTAAGRSAAKKTAAKTSTAKKKAIGKKTASAGRSKTKTSGKSTSRVVRKSKPRGKQLPKAKTYQHKAAESIARPDAGSQAQFKNKKLPTTSRYDSWLASEPNWDGFVQLARTPPGCRSGTP